MSPYRGLDKWAVRKAIRQDVRDAILFLGGLAGIAHETVVAEQPRPSLLLLFGAMIGVIPFLRLDEWLSRTQQQRPRDDDRDA